MQPTTDQALLRWGRRFNGPPTSANGGYAAGSVAALLDGPAEVTLWRPPPLERDLRVSLAPDDVRLWDGDDLVAEAHPTVVDPSAPAPPALEQAREAEKHYPFRDRHPWATCFVCGPDRPAGDGLRIFPGPVGKNGVIASTWVCPEDLADANGNAAVPVIWAALDCPSGLACGDPEEERPLVLARIAAQQYRPVPASTEHVVIGWPDTVDGRKRYGGSAVYSGGGELLAVAHALWIQLRA